MDSTSISDIMGQAEQLLEPPMMSADPRMDTNANASSNDDGANTQPVAHKRLKKNPNLKIHSTLLMTSFEALIVAVCAAAAISKPVQEKLANFVPSFLNDQGNRSAIGLASTGMVAASCLLRLQEDTLK